MTEVEPNVTREASEQPSTETAAETGKTDEQRKITTTDKTDDKPVEEPAEKKPKTSAQIKASHWKPGSLEIKAFTGYALKLRCWKNVDKEGPITSAVGSQTEAKEDASIEADAETSIEPQEKGDSKPDQDESQSESETSETQPN